MLSGVERNKTVEGWWRCSNAASDDVAPRIWRRQHVIMKTRFVSVSRCKSNPRGMIGTSRVLSCGILALIPVFSCQSRMCFRCICVFTSSNFLFARMSLHGLSDSEIMLSFGNHIWRCESTIKARVQLQNFFKKELRASWTITVWSIWTIPNIIVRCIKTSASVYNRYLHPTFGIAAWFASISTSLWFG